MREAKMGANRTGIDVSPVYSKQMISDAEELSPPPSESVMMAAMEQQYIEAAHGVGSVPLPGTLKGVLKTAGKKVGGHNPEVLINKLGERLAYERSGVRLYQSFIRKCETLNGASQSPIPLDGLREICMEEAEHFQVLKECMESIGADPTAQTPDADVSGVAGSGLMKVITDPRTSLSQCLEAFLTIELTDQASWELLISLCDEMGLDEISERFQACLAQEETHVERVKAWYQESVISQV
ncbi:MAG: ferritin-like domain-containing protein [Pseudohongiellaceae bacterium]